MTTSYETETTAVGGSGLPRYNAEGNQVWNPSVGIYHKPAQDQAESYGGIIGALQDLHVEETGVTKAYPHNFAGIIAAIKDLQIAAEGLPPVTPGPNPGGGQIIIDINGQPNWEIIEEPRDGELWFDTRQGRLFVAIDSEWYQTNGADGIPIVTPDGNAPEVEHPIPGQFWWDSGNNDLFIFDGIWELPDGSFVNDGTGEGAVPVWKLITDGLADAFQTTRTLPLGGLGPRLQEAVDTSVLPEIEPTDFHVQSDYNVWLYDALLSLDAAVSEISPVTIGENAPTEPRAGDLWYDTATLELSIWYVDDDSGQWVPTSVAYSFDDELAPLEAAIAKETQLREQAIHHLQVALEGINAADDAEVQELQQEITELRGLIDAIPTIDLQPYAQSSELNAAVTQLNADVAAVNGTIASQPDYALKTSLETLEATVANTATKAELNAVEALIPDVSSYVTADDIHAAVDGISADFLPRTGGTLDGSFVLQKSDVAQPGFDFSTAPTHSKQAFKFQSISPAGPSYATFGTTNGFWEYAWQFESEDDFCWIYNDTNKVFSITKDGPACSTLYLGDIGTTGTNGRVIHNKIDVKERLNTYQTAFEKVRQAVSSSTDYESLKSGLLTALANV